ncbi:MAG: hypothetical protein Q8R18_04985 [bacterium]|nr:hypothetical protein [bacterium]
MKRKIIALGKRTVVLTLPNPWVREKNLNPGDYLELEEHGNWLSLSLIGQQREQEIEQDITHLDRMLNRYIGALYKAGYDKIKLKITKKQLPTIQNTLQTTCVGFEIVKTTHTEIFIHRVAKLEIEEVDDLIKRIFFTLQTNAQDLVLALHTKKKEDFLAVIKKDYILNRYADTARRYVNKEKKDPLSYALAEQLENIGDWYKDQAKEALEKIPKIPIEKLKEINTCIELLYDLYFAFTLEKLEAFGKKVDELKGDLKDAEQLQALLTMLFDIQGVILTKRI